MPTHAEALTEAALTPTATHLVLSRAPSFPCSPAFRSSLLSSFPSLSLPHLALLGHLLFSSRLDLTSGRVLIDRWVLAACEGRIAEVQSRNYDGTQFLTEFREAVAHRLTFNWSGYSFREGKCREAIVDWPPEIQSLVDENRAAIPDETWVSFASGKRLDHKGRMALREELRLMASTQVDNAEWDKQREVLEYLNNLPARSFARFRSGVAAGREELEALSAAGEISAASLESQRRLLNAIAVQPQPFYGPSREGNTERIFAVGESLCSLKREVRKAMCVGLWEFDLKSAQLAIVAKVWGIPELQEFLGRQGASIWNELCEYLEVPQDNWTRAKDVLKEAVYSLVYGRSKRNIDRNSFDKLRSLGVPAPDRFFDHELIQAVWSAKKRKIEGILRDEGLVLHWGKRVELEGGSPLSRIRQIRSLLARHSQAVELDLIHPVYQLASQVPREFKVILHQHDGVTIAFSRREDRWKQRIQEVVRERARELGVLTELEGTKLVSRRNT